MNYQRIYNQLIQNATRRVLTGYKERHHVIPKCIGGLDEKSNLVDLTAREHFVAHALLYRVHHTHGLLVAYINMAGKYPNSRHVDASRERYAKARSEMMLGNTICRGRVWTDEQKANLRKAKADSTYTHSPETRVKLSNQMIGNTHTLGFKHTEASKLKMSQALVGKTRSPEIRAKLSELRKGTNSGSSNPAAKIFELTSPEGEKFIVNGGLEKFVKDNGLGYDGIKSSAKDGGRTLTRGKSKGWRAIEL